MKSTQNIYNKLFSKQKLSSQHKVKFALIDEIDGVVREAEANMTDARSAYDRNNVTLEKLKGALTELILTAEYEESLQQHLSQVEEMRTKLEDAMSALGLPINDSPQHERLLFLEAELSKSISDLAEMNEGEILDFFNLM